MKKEIRVSIQLADITKFEADIVAVKFSGGLFGASLAVAKALGKTEADIQKAIPSLGSLHLVPGHGRIRAKQALFLSVVRLSSFDYMEIYQFSYDVLKGLRTLAPETRHLAMTIHTPEFSLNSPSFDTESDFSLQSELDGCIEAVRAGEYPPCLERITIVDKNKIQVQQLQAALLKILPEGKIEAVSFLAPGDTEEGLLAEQLIPSTEEYDVFISYKSEDAEYAREVYNLLKSHGLRVFFSRESLPRLGSDEYHEQIDLAIERAHHMVIVTTSGEHAMAKWVKYEWRLFLGEKLAGRKNGNLVTVIAGGMDIGDLPISLRNREVVQLMPGDKERLLEYLKKDLE